MSSLYFFTDIDFINSQNSGEEFGPAGISGNMEQFRVTSLHTASATPNAYAICDGIVCVQQDSNNSNLVNLILKPLQQPEFNLPRIRYFIYKGIIKSSIIDSNGEIVVDCTSSN